MEGQARGVEEGMVTGAEQEAHGQRGAGRTEDHLSEAEDHHGGADDHHSRADRTLDPHRRPPQLSRKA